MQNTLLKSNKTQA